ncbi:MAG: ChaN family lipoprotein [Gammaproteobacteria bacterium]
MHYRLLSPILILCLLIALVSITGCQSSRVDQSAQLAELPPVMIFDGANSEPVNWDQLFTAMDAADIIVIGESHTDPRAHEVQTEVLKLAVVRWRDMTLSVEEFDRTQQDALDAFAAGEMTVAELKAERQFVNIKVKENWDDWFLPKLEVARDGDIPILASNAPLQYSRIVRNRGCDNLPDLEPEELELFECPSLPVDPEYRERFAKSFRQATRGRKDTGLKQLGDEQIDKLMRAHRVWDATMADSVVNARRDGADKVLHIVGEFHTKYNGGLIQEMQARDPEAKILVIAMVVKSNPALTRKDAGRGDYVIYTRSKPLQAG